MTPAAPARTEKPPRSLRLEYDRGHGAQNCPTERTLRHAIGASMSFDPFVTEPAPRLLVTIRRKGRMFHGRAEIRDGVNAVLWSTSVVVSDCHLVVDGLGLEIGIKLDPPD